MNRTVALPLIVAMIFSVLGMSWHSSANVATRAQLYKSQSTPTATPTPKSTPSPSPSPGATPTPVPEPEPVPSPTATPFNQQFWKQELR